MKSKIIIVLIALSFVSVSCNPFKKASFAGVVKSVNGGSDWQFSNTIQDSTASLQGVNISKLAFSPENNEIVYTASYNLGLFKSQDSGVSWKQILSKIAVYDFIVSEFDPKIIYAAGFYGGFGKLLKTVDGGVSWLEVYNEQGAENPVRAVAMNPQNPNELIIGTASGGIVKSSDAGNSWKLLKSFGNRAQKLVWQKGGVYILLKNDGLYKATGTLESFYNLTESLTKEFNPDNFTYNTQAISEFNQIYTDTLAGNLLYLTSDKGLFKSIDGGNQWKHVLLPINPEASYTRGIAVSTISSNIVFTSVGSTVYKSLDAGQTWQTQKISTNGFVNYILVNPKLPQIVYAGIFVPE